MHITEDILKQNPNMCAYGVPSLNARQDILVPSVPELGAEAAVKAIEEWGQPKSHACDIQFDLRVAHAGRGFFFGKVARSRAVREEDHDVPARMLCGRHDPAHGQGHSREQPWVEGPRSVLRDHPRLVQWPFRGQPGFSRGPGVHWGRSGGPDHWRRPGRVHRAALVPGNLILRDDRPRVGGRDRGPSTGDGPHDAPLAECRGIGVRQHGGALEGSAWPSGDHQRLELVVLGGSHRREGDPRPDRDEAWAQTQQARGDEARAERIREHGELIRLLRA